MLRRALKGLDEIEEQGKTSRICTGRKTGLAPTPIGRGEGIRQKLLGRPEWAAVGKQVFADCTDRATTAAVGGLRAFLSFLAWGAHAL